MKEIKISRSDALELFTNIKKNTHKATGPDIIPDNLLKILAPNIVEIYTLLFETSLTNDWKKL